MTNKVKPLIYITVILLIATLACSIGGRTADVPLGETFQSDVGGFSLQKVPDYEFDEIWGMVIMAPTDADQNIGPFIMAYGGLIEEEKSTQDILDEMQSQAEEAEFGSSKKTTVDGKDGLLVEFSGDEAGQALKGKLFTVTPFPNQEFYITAMAPEARWEELEPIFDAVLKSVTFFEAQPFEFGTEDWEWDEPIDDPEEAWEAPIETAPVDSPYLGEVYHHLEGGFSVRKIAGYDFSDDFGIITMAKPGLESYAGPLVYIGLDSIEGPLTNAELFDMVSEDPSEANTNYHTPVPYVLDGVEGLVADFDGTEGGEAIQGRVFLAMLSPYEYFSVYAVAPAGEWAEISPIYDALLASVEFSREAAVEPPVSQAQVIRQWAVGAEASSEYTSTDWSAMQATGAPDVPTCGDDYQAWASAEPDTEEYLVLYYETPVNPTELVIYQTYNPSQVVEIQFVDTDGETWRLWYGDPEELSHCPDVWTHTIELDEVFYTDTVVIWVDQSVLGLGWAEIDAVELVGYPIGVSGNPATQGGETQVGDVPKNYSGLMAGPAYQAWLDIIIGETTEAEIALIMPVPVEKFDEPLNTRNNHAQTYLVDMPWGGMQGFIQVNTQGWVYRKYFNDVEPKDFILDSVSNDNFWEFVLPRSYDKNIPYADVANFFESPGFIRDEALIEGVHLVIVEWYNLSGDKVAGIFMDGVLASIENLVFHYGH